MLYRESLPTFSLWLCDYIVIWTETTAFLKEKLDNHICYNWRGNTNKYDKQKESTWTNWNKWKIWKCIVQIEIQVVEKKIIRKFSVIHIRLLYTCRNFDLFSWKKTVLFSIIIDWTDNHLEYHFCSKLILVSLKQNSYFRCCWYYNQSSITDSQNRIIASFT